jgi:hypothetical protein
MELKSGSIVVVVVVAMDIDERGPGNLLVNIRPLQGTEQECTDSADNDGNGLADCNDPACTTKSDCLSTACANEMLPRVIPLSVSGDLTIAEHRNRFQLCWLDYSRERVFAWRSPITGRVVVDASRSKFSARLSVRADSCIGDEVGICPYDPIYVVNAVVATAVDVEIDRWYYFLIGGTNDRLSFGLLGDRTEYGLDVRIAEEENGDRCLDGIDNDGDGLSDGGDPECSGGQ